MTTTNHQHQLDYLSQLPKTFSTTHHSQTASIDPYQIIESELKLNSRTNPGHDFLAQKLSQHENHLQIEFDTLLQQFTTSQSDLSLLITSSKASVRSLQSENESVHQSYLKSEDDLIDRFEGSRSAPVLTPSQQASPITSSPPVPTGLIQSLKVEIEWLEKLSHLKLWFSLLLSIHERSDQLEKDLIDGPIGNQEEGPLVNQIADQLFDLMAEYRAFKSTESLFQTHLHLFELVHQIILHTLQTLLQFFSNQLTAAFEEEIQWPLPIEEPFQFSSSKSLRIQRTFKSVCDFQKKLEGADTLIDLSPTKPFNLDPQKIWFPLPHLIVLSALTKPIELRFRYHFDSQRSSNRLDKPEWYFDHILHRLCEHERFVKGYVQKLLALNGYGTLDAMSQFSSLLIKMVEKKLLQTVPQVLDIKPVLAHTIYKAIDFDTAILERGFQSGSSVASSGSQSGHGEVWLGTAEMILGQADWFETWFEAERKFFKDIASEIINSAETWAIEEEDPRPLEQGVQTTVSTIKLQDLFDQIKTRSEGLPRTCYRARFLIELQLELLRSYLQKIDNVLDAFDSQHGSLGLIRSSVQGVGGGETKMGGVQAGVEKLVKVFISCGWMLSVFESWSDDLYYLELYHDLKRQRRQWSPKLEKMMNTLVEEVEACSNSSQEDPSLFTPFIARFERSVLRSESLIVKHLVRALRTELKPYLAKRWDLEADPVGLANREDREILEDINLTPELIGPLVVWKEAIGSISKCLGIGRPVTTKIYREICNELESSLMERIVKGGMGIRSITEMGGRQLEFDFRLGWLDSIRGLIRRPELGWKRWREVCKLLSLPSSSSTRKIEGWTVSQVVKVCFDDEVDENERLLKEMRDVVGLSGGLSREEMCVILRRRPECWR